MGDAPVFANTQIHRERHTEIGHPFHTVAHDRRECRLRLPRRLEDQFIMNLKHQGRLEIRSLEDPIDLDHRFLDEIGRSALDDGVRGHPLGRLPEHPIARVEIRQTPSPSQPGPHESVFLGLLRGFVQEAPNPRVAREIGVDRLLRLACGDSELLRQTERGRAVDDSEVDCLRAGALIVGDVLERDSRDLSRRTPMDVFAILEGLDERSVAGIVRNDSQFDL